MPPRLSCRLAVVLTAAGFQLAALPGIAQQGQGAYQQQYPPQYGNAQSYPPTYGYAGNAGGYPAAGYPAGGYPGPQAYPPPQGYAPAPVSAQPAAGKAAGVKPGQISVAQWFSHYDNIRHAAQMSPQERQRADALMSRGFSILIPGDEKLATKQLLTSMVGRYQDACQQLAKVPQLSQTNALHHAYYNYFASAGQLFADYVRVQDNLFVTDAQTGQPVASSLIQRKQLLESLEHQCKQMDAQTRAQYGIAPYAW